MKTSKRRFSPTEYRERQARTRAAMAREQLDLLVVSDPSNMHWLTGYDGWSFYVHQCVVIGMDDQLFWFGRGIDGKGAELTTDLPAEQIVCYPDRYVQSPRHHPMEYLSTVLADRALQRSRIGLEKDNYYFSAKAAETLYAGLPQARFSDATGLVNWQRAVKSETELDYMRRAGRVIETVYQRVLEVARPGLRKNELVAEIQRAQALGNEDAWGDYPAIVPLLGAGEEAAACHLTWDGEVLANDTGLFTELAGVHARYHCPVSRTLYFGQPPEKYRQLEAVINDCIETTLPMFRPGASCADVANTFTKRLGQLGYEKDNRCGYPIGLSYPPDWGERTMSLRADDHTELQAGMCFHFMPAIWFDDWGFETTESVCVTDQGGACLSNVPRQLMVIE